MATKRVSVLGSAASVVAHRLRMLSMMIVDPTPARQREAVRMTTEKIEAALEGALAMQIETVKQALSIGRSALAGRVTKKRFARAGKRILAVGRAPANRRVKANGRRLGRRKGA